MKLSSIASTALLVILSITTFSTAIAQNFTASGTIINAESGVAVEFANIGVEGAYLGTASDVDGNFSILLSQALIDKKITVSAVGYQTRNFNVTNWKEKKGLIIQLQPVNYGISEVSIEAKSKVGYGILKNASNLIIKNYPTQSYSYSCYLQMTTNENDSKVLDEAIFTLTDSKGYNDRSFAGAYKNINYSIKENNPHSPTLLLKDGLTFIDKIISQDIVRNPGNILSVQAINEFDVNIIGREFLDNDSVWVLAYACKTPTIQNTGDPESFEYKGKIWISMENHQILKNSVSAVRKGDFRHDNSFYNVNTSSAKVTYVAETTYKLFKGKYVLNTINYSEKQTEGKNKSAFLKVIEVGPQDQSITQRQYFNGAAKDPAFWNEYKRP